MKQEDFDRLKAKLGDEFEILNDSVEDNYKFFVVKKKDIWEGCEFILFIDGDLKGNIYPVQSIGSMINFINRHKSNNPKYVSSNCFKEMVEPISESAYIDQLKKESFERFGEIKQGDRFDRSVLGYLDGEIHFIHNAGYKKGFTYNKDDDRLYFDNLVIYKQGKWATKLPKRIEVEFDRPNSGMVANHYFHTIEYTFNIKRTGKDYPNPIEAGKFLASQLEKYLNNET